MVARHYTYELHLTKDGGSSEEVRDVYVEENQPFRIICSADKRLTQLRFYHDNNNLINDGAITKGLRSEFAVKKFQHEHSGSYTCTAQHGQQKVEKILMVHPNPFVEDIGDAEPCAFNHCKNGGQCYMSPKGRFAPFCVCKAIFAGENCTLVAQYPSARGSSFRSNIAASAALLFLLTTLLMMFMYGRERRQVKRLKKTSSNQISNVIETAAKTGLLEACTVVKATDEQFLKQKCEDHISIDINDNESSKVDAITPTKLPNGECASLLPKVQLSNNDSNVSGGPTDGIV